jgi:putative sterol carrier protein
MTAKEFLLRLPDKVDNDVLDGMDTVFHFDIEGDGGGQITVTIEEGMCISREGLVGDPKCSVKAKDENLMKVLKGDLNPLMAILTGKLKISNQSEMLKYAKIFGLM